MSKRLSLVVRMDAFQGACEMLVSNANTKFIQRHCARPATLRYPAAGGGYMRLCETHGQPRAEYCERWTEAGWAQRGELTP